MKRITLIFLIIFFGVSCKKNQSVPSKKEEPVNSQENTLKENVILIDSNAVASVTDNSVIIAKKGITARPQVGSILISAPSKVNPLGFLIKIVQISESTDSYTCSTVPANLNETFSQLSFSITHLNAQSLSINQQKSSLGKGNRLSATFFSEQSKFEIKFENDNTIANGIQLNGSIVFNIPSVKIEYEKKKGSSLPEKVLIQADFNTEGSTLEITNNDNSSIQVGEKIITSFDLPVIRIPIPVATPVGIIIIPIPFSQTLTIKTFPIKISGKAKWALLPKCSATLGVLYENSTWKNLSSFSIDASSNDLLKGNFAPSLLLTAEVDIMTPEYSIYPYKIDELKAFFAIPNSMDLTLQQASPNYSLKYNLDVTGGIKQEFYTGINKEYSISGSLISKTLLEKDWEKSPPKLTTNNITAITKTTVLCGGNITDAGSSPIIARGLCWSTTPTPTVLASKTSDGYGIGTYVSNIKDLKENTRYYARAYAINKLDTAYGNELSFVTADTEDQDSTFTDSRDGQVYTYKRIGSQVWMTQNLNYASPGSLCYGCDMYGRLYNWNRALAAAPAGWHLPSKAEWDTLLTFVGGANSAGITMKSTSTLWKSGGVNGTNSSGFNALPAGRFTNVDKNGVFQGPGDGAMFWSSTAGSYANSAYGIVIYYTFPYITNSPSGIDYGYSIRCIKD